MRANTVFASLPRAQHASVLGIAAARGAALLVTEVLSCAIFVPCAALEAAMHAEVTTIGFARRLVGAGTNHGLTMVALAAVRRVAISVHFAVARFATLAE